MSNEPDNRDPKVEQRKRELESELERYAQAGVASPNLLRSARWVSRGLYLGMAALAIDLLFSGWGRISTQDFETVVKQRNDLKTRLEDSDKQLETMANQLAQSMMESARLREELREATNPAIEAAQAAANARQLIHRLQGERAYAVHWREKAALAVPGAHGVDPVDGVSNLVRQAATGHAGVRVEVLRLAGADFGLDACRQAARVLLKDEKAAVRAQAALLYSRAAPDTAADELASLARSESDEATAREAWFAWSVLTGNAPGDDVYVAEAWAGYVVRVFDPKLDEMLEVYRVAPQGRDASLFALLAEAAGAQYAQRMSDIAASTQRPDAERIIAVHWFAERNVEDGRKVLEALGSGSGPVAQASREALKRLGGGD